MSKMYEALRKAQEQGMPVEVSVPVIAETVELSFNSAPLIQSTEEAPALEPTQVEPPAYPNRFTRREEPQVFERESLDNSDPVDDRTVGGVRQMAIQTSGRSAVIPWNVANSQGGEQYRLIRTRIVQHPAHPKVIVISSAGSGDGKTVSSINISGVLSLRDKANVLLIDADFRRAGVSAALGLPAGPGLANVLNRTCTLQDALIRADQFPNLYVLTAGTGAGNPAELLDSEYWRALCSSVREHFDFVIIDGPPIAGVADYELIQTVCDGVVFVVRPEHSDRTLVNRAYELIPEKLRLGVVVNCASSWFLWKTHESYYYGAEPRAAS
jgi:capsular exopolysaccharide synthesis family protein